MIDIKTALTKAAEALSIESDSARLDAEVLLSHVLLKNRTYLYSHPEACLNEEQEQQFGHFVEQRLKGMPIAYLTGIREFWSLPLKVTKDTLIPRPETELLVELTLNLLADKEQVQLLDLGTGSGAIALACAMERPDWLINASDFSDQALIIAKENAAQHGLTNLSFHHSNWFETINPALQFDAIVTNPPYIAIQDPHLDRGDVRFEPRLALVSGQEGLDAIKHIIQHSLARLRKGGLLLIEHGFDQKSAVRSMLKHHGYYNLKNYNDLQGNDRVSIGRK